MSTRILVINPGSTSTKIGVFEDCKELFTQKISHSSEDLAEFSEIIDQYSFRKKRIVEFLESNGTKLSSLNCIVARGGLIRPLASGTYKVNDAMVKDLKEGYAGKHASNLGGLIAKEIADQLNVPAYVVDPVVVDELDDLARYTGHPEIKKVSIFHALNQKAILRRAAASLNKKPEEVNMIIAHLGGGISVAAHKQGRAIDVNDALSGEGPFSPERSGALPCMPLVKLAMSGKYSTAEICKMIAGKGGLVAYLGSNDCEEIVAKINSGDKKAEEVLNAMCYSVSKEIAAMSLPLAGNIDAIVLTGGIAANTYVAEKIKSMVSYLGNVMLFPGEDELLALAEGGSRVLAGEEKAKEYLVS